MSQYHSFLNSTRLVALLLQWNEAERAPEKPSDLAEQLGQWLGTVDSVQLSRALHAIESLPATSPRPTETLDIGALDKAFQAARAEVRAFIQEPAASLRPVRQRADNTPVAEPDPRAGTQFSELAPRYLALQKQLEIRLSALRMQMRAGLANGSPALRQLAALDAVMEQMLGPREQRLWALLPVQLEKRLTALHNAHALALERSGQADAPQQWRKTGGWLWQFEQDLQALLLAEMQVRLQPSMGLLQAARNDRNGLTG